MCTIITMKTLTVKPNVASFSWNLYLISAIMFLVCFSVRSANCANINYNNTDAYIVEVRYSSESITKTFAIYDVQAFQYTGTTKKFEQLKISANTAQCMFYKQFGKITVAKKIYLAHTLQGCTGFFEGLEIMVASPTFTYLQNLMANMKVEESTFTDLKLVQDESEQLFYTIYLRFVLSLPDLLDVITTRSSQLSNITLQDFKQVKQIGYFKVYGKVSRDPDGIESVSFKKDPVINEDGAYVDDQGNLIYPENEENLSDQSGSYLMRPGFLAYFIIFLHICKIFKMFKICTS